MTACDLELEILPPYIGSAVSPTVDITETTDDITVTITDFRGEHSYTVDKTDQAIADAEQAASNANTAAANATATANQAAQYARTTADQAAADAQETADAAAGRADTAAASATSAAQAATQAAGTANTAAQNADTKAALADSKAALANQAATTANQAAQAAEAAKTAANTAAGQATTAAGNATTAAGTANTAATNADTKAQLADTAATNADTATAAANTATTNATNAAQAANNAAAVAIEAAEDMPRLIGTVDTAQTVTDAWPTTPESATLYGKSVQDGTPTPNNPVPVETVSGNNLWHDVITGSWIAQNGAIFDVASSAIVILPVSSGEAFTLSFSNEMSNNNVGCIAFYSGEPSETTKIARYAGTSRMSITATAPTDAAFMVAGSYQVAEAGNIQLERGTQATPYIPYGCIGLQTGDTVTPIDLQGHTLAGLPDGTRDVLHVDSAGRVWIDQHVHAWDLGDFAWNVSSSDNHIFRQSYSSITPAMASIPSAYNGYPAPALCDEYQIKGYSPLSASDHGYLAIGNDLVVAINHDYSNVASFKAAMSGVLLYYELAEPQTIELGTITPPEIAPGDTLAIYASLDPEWAIEYTQDPSIVVNTLQSSIAPVEGAVASTNYSVGAYLMQGNQLYRVTSAIATGEAIAPGSNCVACTVMGELARLTA